MNQQIQQNLNQIVSMCNQLSQNEQSNVSKLTQLAEAERNAAQQLHHCAQLCQQISQQIQQMLTQQQFSTTSVGQQHFATTAPSQMGYQSGMATGSWENRPISTGYSTGQYGGSQYAFSGGQYGTGKFETASEISPSTRTTFNTNKDMNS